MRLLYMWNFTVHSRVTVMPGLATPGTQGADGRWGKALVAVRRTLVLLGLQLVHDCCFKRGVVG